MKRNAAALIDEARCIGCTRCIDACPVDAIVGAQDRMHTVVEPWCIGCGLCLPPCPVDCIAMVAPRGPWTDLHKKEAKGRALRRRERLVETRFENPPSEKRRAVIAAVLRGKRR
jgi:electron transport complex protein RnfB